MYCWIANQPTIEFKVIKEPNKAMEKKLEFLEQYLDLSIKLLHVLNTPSERMNLVREILLLIKKKMGFEAVGIRLVDGDDYPYYESNGFPQDFIEAERYLCAYDDEGNLLRNSKSMPVLECMCGNVIRGSC